MLESFLTNRKTLDRPKDADPEFSVLVKPLNNTRAGPSPNLEKQEYIPKQRESGVITVRQKKKKRGIPQVVRGVKKSEGAERFFYYKNHQNTS